MSSKVKTYIIRISKDDSGQVGGHVSDPQTEERLPFQDCSELWQILSAGFPLPSDVAPETTPFQEE